MLHTFNPSFIVLVGESTVRSACCSKVLKITDVYYVNFVCNGVCVTNYTKCYSFSEMSQSTINSIEFPENITFTLYSLIASLIRFIVSNITRCKNTVNGIYCKMHD